MAGVFGGMLMSAVILAAAACVVLMPYLGGA
jgi:hypothetical protein